MKRSAFILLLCIFTACTPPLSGFSQPIDQDSLFSWSVKAAPPAIPQGGQGVVELSLTVAPLHIVYENMTSVSVEGPDEFQAGEPILPKSKTKADPIDGQEKQIYEGVVQFSIPYTIDAAAPIGDMEINVTASYQGCSQTMCYFPQTREFPVTLQITESDGTSSAAIAPEEPSGAEDAAPARLQDFSTQDDFFARGYFLTFILIYFFGVLTSFTPCVYPLIPITVTIFGARKTKNTFQAFTLALTYVIGIAVMYSSLGYAAASTGAVFGQFMSNPWVIGLIALFFAAMGLSMMGLFELQLPSSFQAKLSQVGGEGYASAFFMGLIAGIVAAPCTGPVLAGILAYAATTGNAVLGVSLLLVYSLGLGTLFLVIGTYSGMIQRLPKSGGWMESVKSVFAVILFVCALYFLKNAFPALQLDQVRDWALYVIAAVLLLTGITNGAFHLSLHSPKTSERFRKATGICACVVGLYLPIGASAPSGEGEVNWTTDLQAGLALAQEENKPVMIDFWAEWCTLCKEIDHYTFQDETVADELNERFVNIKIDLTRDNTDEAQAIIQKYKINGLPLIVFYDSQGELLQDKRINEFIEPAEFLDHIQQIP
ncbi:MAG: protein-disulfide reductase DsbD [Candidatus Omnitrophica bacterium]|nr:protein-disulfide reductase DsbD [Candidatus Omnitrophota bacterium]